MNRPRIVSLLPSATEILAAAVQPEIFADFSGKHRGVRLRLDAP